MSTSLRLLAVLTVLLKYASARQAARALWEKWARTNVPLKRLETEVPLKLPVAG